MKKTILIFLLLGTSLPTLRAQQKTVHHLMVTIFETYEAIGNPRFLVETREDGTQIKRDIVLSNPTTTKGLMRHEDTLMAAMKTYFDQGWELTGMTSMPLVLTTTYTEFVTRFFLRKEE